MPARDLQIVARDDAADWFAFEEPPEFGSLSYIAEWLVRRSDRGLIAALTRSLIVLALTGVDWATRRRHRDRSRRYSRD